LKKKDILEFRKKRIWIFQVPSPGAPLSQTLTRLVRGWKHHFRIQIVTQKDFYEFHRFAGNHYVISNSKSIKNAWVGLCMDCVELLFTPKQNIFIFLNFLLFAIGFHQIHQRANACPLKKLPSILRFFMKQWTFCFCRISALNQKKLIRCKSENVKIRAYSHDNIKPRVSPTVILGNTVSSK
jgi:hypothetical protein